MPASRVVQAGKTLDDMLRVDCLAKAYLPDPGRTEEQRLLKAGTNYLRGNKPGGVPGKLVYYADLSIEELRGVRLVDDLAVHAIGLCYMGAFMGYQGTPRSPSIKSTPRRFSPLVVKWSCKAARKPRSWRSSRHWSPRTSQLHASKPIAHNGMLIKTGPSQKAMRQQPNVKLLLRGGRSVTRKTGAPAGGGLRDGVVHPGTADGSGKAAAEAGR